MADLMGLLMKAGGLDMGALLVQASALGETFARIAANQEMLLQVMVEQREGQLAIMTAMGLYVPPPTGEQADIIALETKRYIESLNVGGLLELEASPA